VGVWVGNANGEGRPELKSALTAAPIMFQIYSALPGSAWFQEPEAWMKTVAVCADSGFPAGPDCPRVADTRIPADAKVERACPYCRLVPLSADGRYRLSASDPGGEEAVPRKRFVLPAAVEFYYRAWNFAYEPLPPWKPGSAPDSQDAPLSIIFPEEGSAVYIPIEISGSPGRAVFQAAHRDAQAVLFWHIDDSYVGSTRKPHQMEIRSGEGRHRLTVMDESGNGVTRSFTVLSRM
jgi:penicillin-binding protein 1C